MTEKRPLLWLAFFLVRTRIYFMEYDMKIDFRDIFATDYCRKAIQAISNRPIVDLIRTITFLITQKCVTDRYHLSFIILKNQVDWNLKRSIFLC